MRHGMGSEVGDAAWSIEAPGRKFRVGDRVLLGSELCTLAWKTADGSWMVRGNLGTYAPMRTRELRKRARKVEG